MSIGKERVVADIVIGVEAPNLSRREQNPRVRTRGRRRAQWREILMLLLLTEANIDCIGIGDCIQTPGIKLSKDLSFKLCLLFILLTFFS